MLQTQNDTCFSDETSVGGVSQTMRINFIVKAGAFFIISVVFLLSGCAWPETGDKENHTPTAVISITGDKPVKGDTVQCSGTASTDADGDELAYGWKVSLIPGPVPLVVNDASAGTIIISPDASGLYKIELTVSDGRASDTAVFYVYVRPEGVVPELNASEIKFTRNGENYDISFTYNDWIWYEIWQNPGNTCRWTDFAFLDQGRSLIKRFAYYEPGFEPLEIQQGVIQIYDEVACRNLPRTWTLDSISAAEFAQINFIDSESEYRDSDGQPHINYQCEGTDENHPGAIILTVIE
jgi:hypothetical protein